MSYLLLLSVDIYVYYCNSLILRQTQTLHRQNQRFESN